MSRLASVSARECVNALQRLGFMVKRQNGSHIILAKEGRRVVVPNHNPIKIGTIRSIITQAGLTVDEFIASL